MAEAAIIMTKQASAVDKTIRAKAYSFLEKLAADDSAPGLHIEPIQNVVDSRVRTGRVDLAYRAVLFRLDHDRNRSYVIHGIWHHDEAIARAKRARLTLNPLNGLAEIIEVDEPEHVEVPAPAPAVIEDIPTVLGHSAKELVEGLGLASAMAAEVAECTSESELLDYANQLDEWQGLALISLAQGSSLDEVRAEFKLAPVSAGVDVDSTERILESIRTNPTARANFTYVSDAGELRRIIEGGSFSAWRTWLHPTQRRLVDRDYNGAYRLAGGAGTGKTVVLLHRARRLLRDAPGSKVLLTTFTTNLAEQMRQNLEELDPSLPMADTLDQRGILVLGIDALASAVLRSSDQIAQATEQVLGTSTTDVSRRTDPDAWDTALSAGRDELPVHLCTPAFMASEYAMVVLPKRVTKLAEYLRVARPGRGVRLSRPQRMAVWKVIEAYRAQNHATGAIDFAEAAAIAAESLDQKVEGGASRLFDHVLVDEGQDLGPSHLQLVRALVAEGPNDVFIAEDAHQRIYGHRLVLSHYGLQIRGRSSRLKLNYRTTEENLTLARSILEGADWVDLEGEPEVSADYRSLRNGPEPTVTRYGSLNDEYDAAAQQIQEWLAVEDTEPETIAVLVRDRKQRDQVVAALAERGVKLRAVDRGRIPQGMPVVMTMHRAKGTEFAKVLLVGVSEGSVPATFVLRNLPDEERDEALLRERALLYVAASRARDELVITSSGVESDLLPRQAV